MVVVDTNRPGYTECEELLYMTKTIVVLDHHRQSKDIIQNAVLSYIEPYASSACEMVAEILQYFADGIRIRNIGLKEKLSETQNCFGNTLQFRCVQVKGLTALQWLGHRRQMSC